MEAPMHDARHLRIRIAIILASSGVIGALPIASCGGDVTVGQSTGSSAGAGGAGGGATTATTATTGTASTSTGMGGGASTCMFGMPKQACFTLAELEYMINHPPLGGDVPDAGADAGDGGIMLTDCADRALVKDQCCNPAVSGP